MAKDLASLERDDPDKYQFLMRSMSASGNASGKRSSEQRAEFVKYLKVLTARKVGSRIRGYQFLNEIQCITHWGVTEKTSEKVAAKRFADEVKAKANTEHVVIEDGETFLAVALPLRVELREELELALHSNGEVPL